MRTSQAPILLSLALGLTAFACSTSQEETKPTPDEQVNNASDDTNTSAELAVFVDSAGFEALRRQGATLLDAREPDLFAEGHIPGALNAPWHAFVDGEQTGLLSDDATLQRRVRELGVDNDRPVLVYGAWNEAWGEEGRIYWMLQYLGHDKVTMLRGGLSAWKRQGGPTTTETSTPTTGAFVASPTPAVRATADEINTAIEQDTLVVLDIREDDEFHGATPYGSARGGHIPGAVHFRWKDVFTLTGELKSKEELRLRFEGMGIEEGDLVVAYCTGGIRSGFIYAIMRWMGYEGAQNYDGSWWEWSARSELPVE